MRHLSLSRRPGSGQSEPPEHSERPEGKDVHYVLVGRLMVFFGSLPPRRTDQCVVGWCRDHRGCTRRQPPEDQHHENSQGESCRHRQSTHVRDARDDALDLGAEPIPGKAFVDGVRFDVLKLKAGVVDPRHGEAGAPVRTLF